MKKISAFLSLLLMLVLILPGEASAAGKMQLVVEPAKTEVAAGETVEFTVKLTNVDGVITNMQFNLDIPEGMEYVSGGVVSDNGFEGMEAFNPNKNFQYGMMANDQENTGDVEVLKFTCKASGSGKVTVGIADNGTFKVETDGEGYDVSTVAAEVNVVEGSGSNNSNSSNSSSGNSDENADTSASTEVSIDDKLEDTGKSVKVEDAVKEQEQKQAEAAENAEEVEKADKVEDNSVFWIVMGVIGVLCVVVVVLIIKKMPKKEKKDEKKQD